ncbi:hypothetical protein ABID21_001102 [Pseudorhizobium tarimense]|uniref:DUF1127 domain-containing protein n=1 Tax=Pseudorhizobium tarimense TaxID=1079109 RepID=A0ABV2H3A7_9HYPH
MALSSTTARLTGSRIRGLTRPLTRFALHVQAEWRHRRTERMLESLPAEIRKDIGWPAADTPRSQDNPLH